MYRATRCVELEPKPVENISQKFIEDFEKCLKDTSLLRSIVYVEQKYFNEMQLSQIKKAGFCIVYTKC